MILPRRLMKPLRIHLRHITGNYIMKLENIPYAELNLTYDKAAFAQEYDDAILPTEKPFITLFDQWYRMRELNPTWNVISQEQFDYCSDLIRQGIRSHNGVGYQWGMVNLMRAADDLPDTGRPTNNGGAGWRNKSRAAEKFIKDEFKDLQIVKWIQENIPAKRFVGMHCVSIEPNGWAGPHRDIMWPHGHGPNPAERNGFYREGYALVCLNISSGGVPLKWALDTDLTTPLEADADCYMTSDYFMHAVPMCSSRRRQVRVAFVPDDGFESLLKMDTAIVLPDDFEYSTDPYKS